MISTHFTPCRRNFPKCWRTEGEASVLQVETIEERGQLKVPVVELLSGNRLALHPALQTKRYLEARLDGDQLVLVAGKYIGLIPINQHFSVHVRPKVPVRNLINILSTAREEPEILHGLDRLYGSRPDANVFQLLILALTRELHELELYGLHREFTRQEHTGTNFRGRLLLSETLRRQWSRGVFHQAYFADFAFTRDNAINRSIRYTIWHTLTAYPHLANPVDPAIVRYLSYSLEAFSHVSLDYNRSFLPTLRSWVRGGAIPDSRRYLRRLLQVCLMIIEDLGIALDDVEGQAVSLPPMVINMEDVFQKFLLYSIRPQLRRDYRLTVWNTAVQHQLPLFSPPDRPVPLELATAIPFEEKAKPDFVISDGTQPFLVCDAKYTSGRHRDQVYQVVAHALAYNVRDALLVYPANKQSEAGCKCLGNVGAVRVFTYQYPLDADDLSGATSRLVTEIGAIIRSVKVS